jgi:oligoendopeptidase F
LRDRIGDLVERLAAYAGLSRDQDTRAPGYQAMAGRATTLSVRAGEALSFADPEILALPAGRLEALTAEESGLALYEHALEDLVRTRPHRLSEGEERLLAMSADFGSTPSVVYTMFHNADLRFGSVRDDEGNEIELTHARYAAHQKSRSRAVREEAWRTLHAGYQRFENTLAANLAGNVKRHVFASRARRYSCALEAALDSESIPTEVYRNLVRTVRDRIAPLHRYMDVRRKALGVASLSPWDVGAPLTPDPSRKYPFDEAVQIVREGLAPLGDGYRAAFDEGVGGGWIDVYESRGKRSGAYSWGAYSTKPYLLLNYNDTLDDLFTLAHEMGHSLHSLFTRRSQPYVYGGYSIFVGEVASTTNEALLIERLLARAAGPAEEAVLLNHYLDQIRGTFFVQTMFADFELAIHEAVEAGETLTATFLGDLFRKTYEVYHGPGFTTDPLLAAGWARIPHFYYNFYVYQYTTSYAAATALAARILAGDQATVARYRALLASGSSDYPVRLLARAGVDLTTPEPILDTIARFSAILDRFEPLILRLGAAGRTGAAGAPGAARPR